MTEETIHRAYAQLQTSHCKQHDQRQKKVICHDYLEYRQLLQKSPTSPTQCWTNLPRRRCLFPSWIPIEQKTQRSSSIGWKGESCSPSLTVERIRCIIRDFSFVSNSRP